MYAKVFLQIFDSSISENYLTRLVFEDLLVLSDFNGVVDMTREALSRRTNVPLEIVTKAINHLEQPDPSSRRPNDDGRRLVRLDDHRDWGWMIVNYEYYRQIASDEQRREKTAARVRKYKEKQKGNAKVTQGNAGNAIQIQTQTHIHTQIQNKKEDPPTPASGDSSVLESSEPYRLSQILAASIGSWKPTMLEIQPDRVNKTIMRWSSDIDKMIRLDHREAARIEMVIRWIPSHEGNAGFLWRNNILSADKLRKQFDKLEIAMDSGKGPHNGRNQGTDANRRRDEKAGREFAEDIHAPLL